MIVLFRLTVVTATLVWAMPALSQTQAQQDRLDQIAKFIVTAPMCERLGMKLDHDLASKAESAVRAETTSWTVDPATVEKLTSEALSRQGAILKTDLGAAAEEAKTDARLRQVRDILLSYTPTETACSPTPSAVGATSESRADCSRPSSDSFAADTIGYRYEHIVLGRAGSEAARTLMAAYSLGEERARWASDHFYGCRIDP